LLGAGIGTFGNFYFGKVEIGALFLTVAFLALGDLICSLWPKWRMRRAIFDLAFAVVVMGALSPWLWSQYRSQHAALIDGELIAHDSLPGITEGMYGMDIGRPLVAPYANREPMKLPGSVLTVDAGPNKMLVSIAVRDRNGDLIAEVKNNVWHVYSLASDKNYTKDALEVKDARGRVVLQLQLLKNGIRLGGEWYDEEHHSFRIVPHGRPDREDPGFHRNDVIAPWFKYGSKDHWGEYDRPGE
jgi:hypothetical protein